MRAAWLAIGLALTLSGAPLQGQSAVAPPEPPMPPTAPAVIPSSGAQPVSRNADDIREELGALLRQQPPALRRVLRITPSLARNAEFLAPYPALATYLAAHPEVYQNSAYYFGTSSLDDDSPSAPVREFSDMVDAALAFLGLMSFLGAVTWFSTSLLDHQRWKRTLKVQSDAHARIVERLSSTEDVLAYAQTPAGRQFLESGAPIEMARPGLASPVGRILWSVQVGTVISVLGIGTLVCARMLGADAGFGEVAAFLRLMGTLGVAIGIGFLVSAAISYVLSQRLGLLPMDGGHAVKG